MMPMLDGILQRELIYTPMPRQELIAEIEKLRPYVSHAQHILLISHKQPDGDTIGATLAMYHAFRAMGKESTPVCVDLPAPMFHFLPGYSAYVQDFQPEKYDLIMAFDAGAHYMIKFHEKYPDIFKGPQANMPPLINIDHHGSNDNFGSVNIVDSDAASTTLILFYAMQILNIRITREIATCLLTGLYTDTGSFLHSNTTGEVYRIASFLTRAGADVQSIARNCFKQTPLSTLRLWGQILENMKINEEGVVLSVARQSDFRMTGSTAEDLSGVINYLNAIPGTKFSVLLSEDEKGNVKGSFRTQKEEVDVAKLASFFGGGGHPKAAGFTLKGRIEKETIWKIAPPCPKKEELLE